MPKKDCGCGSKSKSKVPNFSKVRYIVKDMQGNIVKEYGNRASAAIVANRNASYSLHEVVPAEAENK